MTIGGINMNQEKIGKFIAQKRKEKGLTQQDIYSDIMYPNDKRPKENHGYNTEYKG